MNAFGRYEIVRRIGVGGMGEVFFAYAYGVARTKKPVVVKVLRAEMLAEPGAPEMFVEEGRLSLRLSHSNVLQVFDFGKADDRYFMAMEFVDGYHLGELRKRAGGRLAPEHAAFVAMEVCLALDYAHRLKDDAGSPLHIVHRDVTPSNVLISREGEVKLADFGIARSVGRTQHTQAGQIRGKVRYMSPEAARGEPLDHRADLFSLGAILFELLTGRRAFDAKGREAILQQVVGTRVVAPSSVSEDLPPALDEVVTRATAPRRDDRFPDAFAMHRALEAACRSAQLAPSRGGFLEFLRALDVDPTEDASAPASAGDVAAAPSAPLGRITPSVQPPVIAPVSASVPAGGGAVPRDLPAPGATEAVPPPTPGPVPAPGTADRVPEWPPPLSGSRTPSRPSSSAGSVPAPVKGPETVLPTGVASPVLFTLTVAGGEMTPSFAGADVADLPLFEVTRGEGIDVGFRDLERITPRREQGSVTPEPLFPPGARELPDRVSASEETVVREPTPVPAPAAAEARREPTRSRAMFEVPPDMPLSEETQPPVRFENGTPVPAFDAAAETTVPPLRASASGSAAAETEIRVRPDLDEAGAEPERDPVTGDTRDTVDHVPGPEDERPTRPPAVMRREGATGSSRMPAAPPAGEGSFVDASARWRRRGPMPDEPSGVDYPAARRAGGGRVALLTVAVVAIVLLGWFGSRMLAGFSRTETPIARPTPFPERTAIARATPPETPSPAPSAAAPDPTPEPTAPMIRTPAPTPRVVRATRTPPPDRPTPRATEAAPVQFGIVTINTSPWSEVRSGGKLLGTTPLKNVRFPAGRHVLSFRNPVSGVERSVEVDVRPNETRTFLFDLSR